MATVKKHFVVGSTEDFCDRSHFIMSLLEKDGYLNDN